MYATIHSIVINQINTSKGQIYFPFIYTLFIFILVNNLIGMVPYSFASTSHFILTFSISFTYNIMTSGFIFFFFGLIPLAFIIAFSGLELAIAFIQAQVFVVLTSSYIKDAMDLH